MVPLNELAPELAFDHRRIIDYALLRLRPKSNTRRGLPDCSAPRSPCANCTASMKRLAANPRLGELRRKMLASGDLEDTGEKMREGRQRPATVYRYIPKTTCRETVRPTNPMVTTSWNCPDKASVKTPRRA